MNNKMIFHGTGAGEAIPDPFCSCRICENARKVRGKEIRTRSCFRVDEETIIDPGADYVTQCIFYGYDLTKIKNIIYTHTHGDHYDYTLPWERIVSVSKEDGPIHIYFTDDAYDILEKFYMTSVMTEGREGYTTPNDVVFHRLEFGTTESIGSWKVTPYRGRHAGCVEKSSANYIFEDKNGKKLYYALDSGWFPDETYEALRGASLDIFIGECTYNDPNIPAFPKHSAHMNLPLYIENCDKLLEIGAIREDTKIYATHINPTGITHAELEDYLETLDKPYRITAAYDTLEIGF